VDLEAEVGAKMGAMARASGSATTGDQSTPGQINSGVMAPDDYCYIQTLSLDLRRGASSKEQGRPLGEANEAPALGPAPKVKNGNGVLRTNINLLIDALSPHIKRTKAQL